ncbi:MAG: SPOR domain-containing protein [Deltaproteobacteria bacterium]|jgi:hypothetical protein|nr:SPOR domain-containing protein [Deltaproteobacteria bacterium]
MFKDLFLAPGRFLYGIFHKNTQQRLKYKRINYVPAAVPPLALASWLAIIFAAVLFVFKVGTDPLPKGYQAPEQAKSTPDAGQIAAAPSKPDQATAQAAAQAAAAQVAVLANRTTAEVSPPIVEEPKSAPSIATQSLPPAQAWLVIVESIPKKAREEAEQALARHKRKGLELELMDTDAYPLLKSGMWTIAKGPFDTKKEAEAAAKVIKPKVRDLMIRRGL